MSLEQAYRDLIKLTIVFGLVFTFLLALYEFVVTHEIFYFFVTLILFFLMTLISVARYVAIVDFWNTIMKYWQRMRLRTKYCSNCGAINDRDAIYCKKCGKAIAKPYQSIGIVHRFDY